MDIVTLKKRLIDKIQATENSALLEEVQRLLILEKVDETDTYQLNEEQQYAIAEARDDIKNGRLLSSEQAKLDIDKWLKK
ncbi:MAG: hypothetical protein ACOH2D_05850 [Gelidibacter sp.]